MAIDVYCDYCGEPITGKFATIEAGGLRSPTSIKRELFQYHPKPSEGEFTACYEKATRVLSDIGRWAHREEGTGLSWRLDRLPRASEAPNPKMASTAPVRGSLALGVAGLHPSPACSLRRAGVRTLEEAAERSEVELLAIEGVARGTVRQLGEALSEHGMVFSEGPTPEELGVRIRELREAAGLRRSEVAQAIRTDGDDGLYESDLCNWESGRRVPSPRRLERVAAFFGVPVEKFTTPEVEAG